MPTWEETRTLAPVGLLATDSEEAEGTVVHTLAILTDAFPADEQEEPLLAGGTAILLRAYDAARAVAPQTGACCRQTRWKKESQITHVSYLDGRIGLLTGCNRRQQFQASPTTRYHVIKIW